MYDKLRRRVDIHPAPKVPEAKAAHKARLAKEREVAELKARYALARLNARRKTTDPKYSGKHRKAR